MSAENVPYTIHNAMIACGVIYVFLFEGHNQAEPLASNIFNYAFITCIERTINELDANFETHAALI